MSPLFRLHLFRIAARSAHFRRDTAPAPCPPALPVAFSASVLSRMGTLIFAWPLRKLMSLCCQFLLMLAVRNHGHPNRRGYAHGASSANTTTDISHTWPPMMIDNLHKSPRGLTERVSAILSQKGQLSHDVMPRLLHVALLMTFTPETPSTIHPVISVPCTNTFIARFWWSIISGPLDAFVKCDGMVVSGVYNRDSMAYRKRSTRLRILLMVSVIGQSASACQIAWVSDGLSSSTAVGMLSWRICSTFASLAFVTRSTHT